MYVRTDYEIGRQRREEFRQEVAAIRLEKALRANHRRGTCLSQDLRRILATGVLLALLATSLLAASPANASTTFYVNSTADHADQNLAAASCDTGYTVTGTKGEQEAECTLRAAINQANFTSGADTINFAIPGRGVKTIAPKSALPKITEAVSINGYTQPGASANAKAVGSDAVLKIELSGAGVPDGNGLVIEASNSTVRGLVINRSSNSGIIISGPDATGNKIMGNYIGTDASGTRDLGNGSYGVAISGASGNVVGGGTAGARNVISGNHEGLLIAFANAKGNAIMGNYIGTDKNGTTDLGNYVGGLTIFGAPNNTVGGTGGGARNVVSANGSTGIVIREAAATGNRVVGNHVGTDASGTRDLGNGLNGVLIFNAVNNTVGGDTAGARNVISGNNNHGVEIFGGGSTGARVLSNSIFSNGGLGIDLDTNNLQAFPVLSSAKKSTRGTTTVKGTLNSTPDKTFRVQFFSNPSGTDEGKTFLGSKSVSTDGTGNASITFSTKKAVRPGQNITATATGPSGNTSEFSAPRRVVAL